MKRKGSGDGPGAAKLRYRRLRQRLLESYALAAGDPEFLADDHEITRAFDPAVADGSGGRSTGW